MLPDVERFLHVALLGPHWGKIEEEERRKLANKLTVIPALIVLPISSDAQCLLCCHHSALLSFGQILCRGNPG